jgi:hypothetical protein
MWPSPTDWLAQSHLLSRAGDCSCRLMHRRAPAKPLTHPASATSPGLKRQSGRSMWSPNGCCPQCSRGTDSNSGAHEENPAARDLLTPGQGCHPQDQELRTCRWVLLHLFCGPKKRLRISTNSGPPQPQWVLKGSEVPHAVPSLRVAGRVQRSVVCDAGPKGCVFPCP